VQRAREKRKVAAVGLGSEGGRNSRQRGGARARRGNRGHAQPGTNMLQALW